jgi:NAD(P)H-hydrate epimerase
MKIVSATEMRAIDRATSERFGVPSLTLMENAGSAVARFVIAEYPQAERIGIVCGKGNNGGDGFVAARKLAEAGRAVRVLLLADPAELRGDAAVMFERTTSERMTSAEANVAPLAGCGKTPELSTDGKGTSSTRAANGVELPAASSRWGTASPKNDFFRNLLVVRDAAELDSPSASEIFASDVLVDAVLGTGFRPPVSALYAAAIAKMNRSAAPVVAVDIPSGADADATQPQQGIVARANAVVTFTAPRPAHIFAALTSGPTVIAPIGSPPEAITSELGLHVSTPADFSALLQPRPRESNKGSYGHVLAVGGSLGKAGAAAMAGFSALRAGAGLSTVATPKSVLATVAGFHPELMTEPLAETGEGTIGMRAFESIVALAERKTVVAIGPGISRNPETSQLVRSLLKSGVVPENVAIVLDADGLNAFEGVAGELNGEGRSIVITPHPGEMARLTGMTIPEIQANRVEVARKFSRKHKLIVVLKGHRTLIAAPDGTVWVNSTGNPGMATGGTGDVLTGMVAGLIAQHPQQVLEATTLAVYLHGLAGDLAAQAVEENSLVATDLVRFLPEAFAAAQRQHSGEFRMHG